MIAVALKLLCVGTLASGLGLALKSQRAGVKRQYWLIAALMLGLLPLVALNVKSLVITLPAPEATAVAPSLDRFHLSTVETGSLPPAPESRSFPWAGFLLGVYGSTLLVLGIRIAYGLRSASLIAAKGSLVQDSRLLQIARDAGLVSEIKMSTEVSSPCVCGVLSQVVVLPEGALEWSDEELRACFVHEAEHVRGRDCGWQLALTALAALQWPSPFGWLAARGFRLASEEAADEAVLRAGVEPALYARQLLSLARAMSRVPGLAMSMVGGKHMKTRINSILSPRGRGSRLAWLAVAVLPLLAVPVAAVSLSQEGADPFKWSRVTPEASKIELARISEFLGDGSVSWNPDGSANSRPVLVRPNPKLKIGRDERLIVFDLSARSLGSGPGIEVFVNGAPAVAKSMLADRTFAQAVLPVGAETADLKVGAASGQWVTRIKDRREGGASLTQVQDGVEEFVRISHVQRDGSKIRYTVVDNMSGLESMLVAVSKQGAGHGGWPTETTMGDGVRTRVFEIDSVPWEKVTHIEFRTRPYYYVEFKDVPLRPKE